MPTPERLVQRLELLLNALVSYGADRVYLFGSAGRGEADELSDLDVVVIKETNEPFLERLRHLAGVIPAESGGADVLVYTSKEFEQMQASGNAFAEMIVAEGKVIYERQPAG